MNNAQLINQTSNEVEYFSPAAIVEAARRTMGGIDLDPASCKQANGVVKATEYFTKDDDGLKQKWYGRVWVNWPFGRGRNKQWVDKIMTFFTEPGVEQLCCLCYACSSEQWFKPLLFRPQCFLTPRTNYLLPDGSVMRGVTKGSVVTYFGPNVDAFAREFLALGVVKIPYSKV